MSYLELGGLDVFEFFINLTNCEEEISQEIKANEEAMQKNKRDKNK